MIKTITDIVVYSHMHGSIFRCSYNGRFFSYNNEYKEDTPKIVVYFI